MEETKEEAKKTGKIEISKDVLDELLAVAKRSHVLEDKVAELEKNAVAQDTRSPRILRTPKSKEIGIRKYAGKIVIGWEDKGTDGEELYVYEVFDEQRREFVQYINVYFLGEKKSTQIKYIDYFRKSVKTWFEVKEEKELEPISQESGFVRVKEMADNGYGMMITDVMVPIENIIKRKSFVIVIEGQEIEIDEKFIG